VSGQAYCFHLEHSDFCKESKLFSFSFFLSEKDQADHLMEVGDLSAFDNVALTCLC